MRSFICALLFCHMVFAKELVVVGNRTFPKQSLTLKEIQSIFLSKKRFISGDKVLVMNFEANTPLRRCFEKSILKKSQSSLERYWRKAYYQGKHPPKVVKSLEMLFSFLKKVNPSIGYIEAGDIEDKNISILYREECN